MKELETEKLEHYSDYQRFDKFSVRVKLGKQNSSQKMTKKI